MVPPQVGFRGEEFPAARNLPDAKLETIDPSQPLAIRREGDGADVLWTYGRFDAPVKASKVLTPSFVPTATSFPSGEKASDALKWP